MQFLIDNYIILIIILLFVTFALIGYLIDIVRNSKKDTKVDNNTYEKIEEIEVKDKEEIKTEKNTNSDNILDKADELLESYNNVNLE